MRIAVTGASGFVGGRIARTLAERSHEVLSFGRRPASALTAPLPNYSVWNPASIIDVDAVIHCAALVGDWGPERDYVRTNVDGTRDVLHAFASAKRVVVVSTASVYSSHGRNVREDDPTGDCLTAYGRTKAAAESLVLRERPDAVLLRPHIVYGPGDTTLLPRVIEAKRFDQLPVPGDGTNFVSVTHVDNLVSAVERSLESRERGAFNIADAEPVTIAEALRTIFARLNVPVSLRFIPRSVAWRTATALETMWLSRRAPRGPVLTRYVVTQLADELTLDISRARSILGYSPRWTYRDGPL